MSVRPILLLGDPRLRLPGAPVESFGKLLHSLLDDLAHTMRAAPGVGLVAEITRRERVWVEAQDRNGRPYKFSEQGFLSRAVQHELDHLAGTLYIDYLDSMDQLIAVDEDDDEEPGDSPEAAVVARRRKALRGHSHK